jgi:hypothetical protein
MEVAGTEKERLWSSLRAELICAKDWLTALS